MSVWSEPRGHRWSPASSAQPQPTSPGGPVASVAAPASSGMQPVAIGPRAACGRGDPAVRRLRPEACRAPVTTPLGMHLRPGRKARPCRWHYGGENSCHKSVTKRRRRSFAGLHLRVTPRKRAACLPRAMHAIPTPRRRGRPSLMPPVVVLERIRRLAARSEGLFRVHRTHGDLYARARRQFGSWAAAVVAAGCDYQLAVDRARQRALENRRRRATRERPGGRNSSFTSR